MTWGGMGIRTDAVQCEHRGCAKWARREVAADAPGNTLHEETPQKARGMAPSWVVDPNSPTRAHVCCGRHCSARR